mgnify:CR=1 FL=1
MLYVLIWPKCLERSELGLLLCFAKEGQIRKNIGHIEPKPTLLMIGALPSIVAGSGAAQVVSTGLDGRDEFEPQARVTAGAYGRTTFLREKIKLGGLVEAGAGQPGLNA